MTATSTLLFILVTAVLLPTQLVAQDEESVNSKCRELLSCAVKKECIKTQWLGQRFQDAEVSTRLYDDLDSAINYGCIFTTGCADACSKCPLCTASRKQIVAILTKEPTDECPILETCALSCVGEELNITNVNFCLREKCAIHCFDGSCPRCKAFTTRVFNQACASAQFRKRVKNFDGRCHEMFDAILAKKFANEFSRTTTQRPSKRRRLHHHH
uniref:Uncharacterized protein n=1 Tax=Plectus sambesii TaxID=2011161 RepID=A0A914V3B0_9BILA